MGFVCRSTDEPVIIKQLHFHIFASNYYQTSAMRALSVTKCETNNHLSFMKIFYEKAANSSDTWLDNLQTSQLVSGHRSERMVDNLFDVLHNIFTIFYGNGN